MEGKTQSLKNVQTTYGFRIHIHRKITLKNFIIKIISQVLEVH